MHHRIDHCIKCTYMFYGCLAPIGMKLGLVFLHREAFDMSELDEANVSFM